MSALETSGGAPDAAGAVLQPPRVDMVSRLSQPVSVPPRAEALALRPPPPEELAISTHIDGYRAVKQALAVLQPVPSVSARRPAVRVAVPASPHVRSPSWSRRSPMRSSGRSSAASSTRSRLTPGARTVHWDSPPRPDRERGYNPHKFDFPLPRVRLFHLLLSLLSLLSDPPPPPFTFACVVCACVWTVQTPTATLSVSGREAPAIGQPPAVVDDDEVPPVGRYNPKPAQDRPVGGFMSQLPRQSSFAARSGESRSHRQRQRLIHRRRGSPARRHKQQSAARTGARAADGRSIDSDSVASSRRRLQPSASSSLDSASDGWVVPATLNLDASRPRSVGGLGFTFGSANRFTTSPPSATAAVDHSPSMAALYTTQRRPSSCRSFALQTGRKADGDAHPHPPPTFQGPTLPSGCRHPRPKPNTVHDANVTLVAYSHVDTAWRRTAKRSDSVPDLRRLTGREAPVIGAVAPAVQADPGAALRGEAARRQRIMEQRSLRMKRQQSSRGIARPGSADGGRGPRPAPSKSTQLRPASAQGARRGAGAAAKRRGKAAASVSVLDTLAIRASTAGVDPRDAAAAAALGVGFTCMKQAGPTWLHTGGP